MDGGATFDFTDIGTGADTPARYGAFPSSSVRDAQCEQCFCCASLVSSLTSCVCVVCVLLFSRQVGFVSAGTWPPNAELMGAHSVSSRVHIHSKNGKMKMHLDRRTAQRSDDAGWTAAISRSVDGFNTWTTVFTNTSFYFNQISCYGEQVCYAAGENDNWGVSHTYT